MDLIKPSKNSIKEDMYLQVLAILRRAWHAHAIFWAHNETGKSALRSCVVLTPHPDDETIGMGATIARKVGTGSRVKIAVATDGRYSQNEEVIGQTDLIALRKKEFIQAITILGLNESDVIFLDEEDSKINVPNLKSKFEGYLDSLDFIPDELMTTSWYDGHVDHQMCAKVVKEIENSRKITARYCPIYWWAMGPSRFHREKHSFVNRQLGKFLDLKHAFLERGWTVEVQGYESVKLKALSSYQSQITQQDDNPNWDVLDKEWLETFDRKREYFIKI